MSNVLVVYASKHGATEEIARAIAGALRDAGLNVDCEKAADVKAVEHYDGVVLGSAVYMRRWRGDAKRFLRKFGVELSEKPFWVFSSGPTGDPADDDPEWLEPQKVMRTVERLGAREHVVFGGRLPVKPRGVTRGMVEGTPPEYRDRRDWKQIRAWAMRIASELRAAVPVG